MVVSRRDAEFAEKRGAEIFEGSLAGAGGVTVRSSWLARAAAAANAR